MSDLPIIEMNALQLWDRALVSEGDRDVYTISGLEASCARSCMAAVLAERDRYKAALESILSDWADCLEPRGVALGMIRNIAREALGKGK